MSEACRRTRSRRTATICCSSPTTCAPKPSARAAAASPSPRSTASGSPAYFLHLRDRGYSSASIARKTAALRSFFQYLRRKGEVATDPTQGIGSPEFKKPLPRTVEDDHVTALLAFCESRDTPEGLRDHAMLRLLSATGMRVGELVMVDVDDIDFANGRVRVVGRGNRERSLPLDASHAGQHQGAISTRPDRS